MAGGLFSPCVESVKQPFQSDALQALLFFAQVGVKPQEVEPRA